MEYAIPPLIILLFLRIAFPALITWFFEDFVGPRAEITRKRNAQPAPPAEISTAEKMKKVRGDLDGLRKRLD